MSRLQLDAGAIGPTQALPTCDQLAGSAPWKLVEL